VPGAGPGAGGQHVAKGLVAVQRFTGYGLTEQDLDRIEAAGIAFRIALRVRLSQVKRRPRAAAVRAGARWCRR
jgi:hypothetical protein